MKAYIFPGQGAQFVGMGKELYENSPVAKEYFEEANKILGFNITEIMFSGTEDQLKQTKVTQPAIFLHSVISAKNMGSEFAPEMAAGHSLGEFSALAACGCLSFSDALLLVSKRAMAMQKACEANPSTMAAVLGVDDEIAEKICRETDDIVVPANYNTIGQLVISGTESGIEKAMEKLNAAGAKTIKLNVGGAFHSPLMESAREELEKAINNTKFNKPVCPIYQNVSAKPVIEPEEIKKNLILQLTAPVMWTQTVKNMISGGASSFTEIGPGKVLSGLVKKVDRKMPTFQI